jgi:hypothetical protein
MDSFFLNHKWWTSLTGILDLKQEWLTPSLPMYNGSIHWLASVLSKKSLA